MAGGLMAITSLSFKIARWRALVPARILFATCKLLRRSQEQAPKHTPPSRDFLAELKLKVDEERRYQ